MADKDLKVIVKAKELALHSYRLTANANHFPKKYRHSIVDKINIKVLDIYDTLLEANRTDNRTHKKQRCEKITKVITFCDELLFYIELSMNLHFISKKSAEFWSKKASDVKYMSIAWRTKEINY